LGTADIRSYLRARRKTLDFRCRHFRCDKEKFQARTRLGKEPYYAKEIMEKRKGAEVNSAPFDLDERLLLVAERL
jgi:hypothetical protein